MESRPRAPHGYPEDRSWLESDLGLCRVTGAIGGPTLMTLFKCHPSTEPSTLASPVCPLPGDNHGSVLCGSFIGLCPAHVRLPPGLAETDSGASRRSLLGSKPAECCHQTGEVKTGEEQEPAAHLWLWAVSPGPEPVSHQLPVPLITRCLVEFQRTLAPVLPLVGPRASDYARRPLAPVAVSAPCT